MGTLGKMEQWMERREVKTLVGKILMQGQEIKGESDGKERDEEKERGSRKLRNEKVNGEGRKLIEFVEENGWNIFNGDMKKDEEGEYTYMGGK